MREIAAFASGGIETASSRLRSFYLFYCADEASVVVRRAPGFLASLRSGQLHLQKRYRLRDVGLALLFRCLGKQVVFDIDDQAEHWAHRAAIFVAMNVASIVTTDTDERAAYCRRLTRRGKVVVIHDVMDVPPERASDTAGIRSDSSHGIFWTGHRGNLCSIDPLLRSMANEKQLHMIVATNLDGRGGDGPAYPGVSFVQWKQDCAFDRSYDVGFMVLNHNVESDPGSLYKSENKMVLAIAAGLVPIVSRTPAYERLAKILRAECLIFDEFAQVRQIILSLDREWRHDFIDRAQRYVLDVYASPRVFESYMRRTGLIAESLP